MANTRTGNVLYIDSTGVALTVTGKGAKVTHIVYTAGAAAVTVDVFDGASDRKFLLALTSDNSTVSLDLSANPMSFRTSININSITSGLLMLVLKEG